MSREEFEKLPFIKLRMDQYNVIYDSDINCYVAPQAYLSHADWVGGAWYAYQEQQKKIDGLNDELEILKAGEDY